MSSNPMLIILPTAWFFEVVQQFARFLVTPALASKTPQDLPITTAMELALLVEDVSRHGAALFGGG